LLALRAAVLRCRRGGRDAAVLTGVELLTLRATILRGRRDAAVLTGVELLALRAAVLRGRRDAAVLAGVELLALRAALFPEPGAAILQWDEHLARRTIGFSPGGRTKARADKRETDAKEQPNHRCFSTHDVLPIDECRRGPRARLAKQLPGGDAAWLRCKRPTARFILRDAAKFAATSAG
jgi:hypothetical protein